MTTTLTMPATMQTIPSTSSHDMGSVTTSITAYHETMLGERDGGMTLNFPTTRVTLHELIRACVYEETRAYNRRLLERVENKVTPGKTEFALNNAIPAEQKKRSFAALKPLDWEEQAKLALQGFERNRYFVLIGERQLESLETEIELTVGAEVTFLRLIPLAGG